MIRQSLLITCIGCGGATGVEPVAHHAQSITYVGKTTTTDFTGLGQHLQYWPAFGNSEGRTAQRTDDNACIELTPDFEAFKHHYIPEGRTFSNDALGVPIGTKTRGGYPTWATFTLPDGRTGRSGTFYDESNIDNSNNTINQMVISANLTSFCLNLITDNTNHEHDPNVRLEARSDTVDFPLEDLPEFGFDGQTDMYTLRYEGMDRRKVFKVRMQCSSTSGCQGAGLGGVMVSHISTCGGTPDGPDAGPQDPGMDPPVEDQPEAGGCNAGGSQAGLVFALFALSFAGRRGRSSMRRSRAR